MSFTISSLSIFVATLERIFKCSSPTPAIPITNFTVSSSHFTPSGMVNTTKPDFLIADFVSFVPWGIASPIQKLVGA